MAISKRKWSGSFKKRKGGMEGMGKPITGPKQTTNYAQLRPIPTPMARVAPKVNISAPTPWVNTATGKALKVAQRSKKKKKK